MRTQSSKQTPLPEGARTIAKAIMLRRINEARRAMELPRFDALVAESRPTSCSRCVLATHLPIHAAWQREIQFDTNEGSERTMRRVRAVAEAWGVECPELAAGAWLVNVALPPDLIVATQAFDAGQIPELIDSDLGYVDPEDLAEPVAPVMVTDHPAFFVGATVRTVHPIERFPHFMVPSGSTGVVVVADAERVSVRMDDEIPGAEEWSNEVEWYCANGDNPAEDLEGYSFYPGETVEAE